MDANPESSQGENDHGLDPESSQLRCLFQDDKVEKGLSVSG
jgi:hypothetical protein